jgi:hypothetical protein
MNVTSENKTENIGNQDVSLLPGQFIFSYSIAEKNTGLSMQNLRTCIRDLKNKNYIDLKSTNKYSVITICNYTNNKDTKTDKQQASNKQTTSKQQASGGFKIPTIQQIEEYAKKINYNLDPDIFFNSYNQKGWMVGKNKMVDWKSAVVNWKKNRWGERMQSELFNNGELSDKLKRQIESNVKMQRETYPNHIILSMYKGKQKEFVKTLLEDKINEDEPEDSLPF